MLEVDLKIKKEFSESNDSKTVVSSLKKRFFFYGDYLSSKFNQIKPIERVEWLWSVVQGSLKNAYAKGYKRGYIHAMERKNEQKEV